MTTKKVLIFTDFFLPHWTGISKSIYYLVKSLSNTYDITVLTVKFDSKLKDIEKIEGAKVIRSKYLLSISRSKYSVNIIIEFLRNVAKTDVVIVNSPSANILPVSLITKLFNKKLIIFHQGDLILPKGIFNKLIEILFNVSNYLSLTLADTASTYTLDYARNSRVLKPFMNKCKALLLPIYFSPSNAKNKKLLKLKEEGFILFGFAGRFVAEKGFDILFKAVAEVVKKHDNVKFIFAGETNVGYENFYEENNKLLSKIESSIVNLGLLNDTELKGFYNSIDFIIIPSRSDCFNLVQAEAMLSGAPSIVSDIPGAREMVRRTKFGLIFKKEDSSDLAKNINQAIERRKEFAQYKKNINEILNNKKNVEEIKKVIG